MQKQSRFLSGCSSLPCRWTARHLAQIDTFREQIILSSSCDILRTFLIYH